MLDKADLFTDEKLTNSVLLSYGWCMSVMYYLKTYLWHLCTETTKNNSFFYYCYFVPQNFVEYSLNLEV